MTTPSKTPNATDTPQNVSLWRRAGSALLLVNVAALVAVAIAFRLWRLGSLPGVNGDEAWFGVQAVDWLAGRSIEWWTPSGNVLPQFFFWPTVALHAMFEPSFALLRAVAVVSGLAALLVNFFLCRRTFELRTAIVSTIVLAILPINIAYSRFGWETSQTLLFATVTYYTALLAVREPSRRLRWSILAFFSVLASLLVHLTNLFLVPIVAVALCFAWRDKLRAHLDPRIASKAWRWKWAVLIILADLGVYLAGPWGAVAIQNATQPTEWMYYAQNFGRLFSGTTTYEFVSGGASVAQARFPWHTLDMLFWVCFGAAVFGLARLFRREDDAVVRCLAWGWAAAVLAFFLAGGSVAIGPHRERYALWMIGPTAALLSIGVSRWIARANTRRAAPWVWSAAAWLMLLGFHTEYLDHFVATGGTSHHTFRTGIVEPKQQAYEFVLQEVRAHHAASPALIVTSEWWSYWSLRYLAGSAEDAHVVMWDEYMLDPHVRAVGRVWFVEFADSDGLVAVRAHLAAADVETEETPILDYTGRHAMYVLTTNGRPGLTAVGNTSKNNRTSRDVATTQHRPVRKNHWFFRDFLKFKS